MHTTPIILPWSYPKDGWEVEGIDIYDGYDNLAEIKKIRLIQYCRQKVEIRVLNFCDLQFLIKHPAYIPKSWKDKCVFFLGNKISSPLGEVYYPYLRFVPKQGWKWWIRWKKGTRHPFDYIAVV